MVPHFGASVWGVVYELHEQDLARLDRFESGYVRVQIEVEDDAGRWLPAVSYSVQQKRSFRPTSTYLNHLLRWGEAWQLPDEYLAALRLTPVLAKGQ